MKIKTSVTLSEELLNAIDEKSGQNKSRSDFIEKALWIYIEIYLKEVQDRCDLEIINNNSDRLNNEASDVLDYQVPV
ncbi:hypothetical protein IIC38_00145 [candidate division KSB1 bacterium]|nr:hypothetical protein [candidate division KSB1 bacterium]